MTKKKKRIITVSTISIFENITPGTWPVSGTCQGMKCIFLVNEYVIQTSWLLQNKKEGSFCLYFTKGQLSEAYSEPNQTSKMEPSAKIANGQTSFTMFAKYYT